MIVLDASPLGHWRPAGDATHRTGLLPARPGARTTRRSAFLLSAVFLAAWTSGLVGLAPIIGAFLAGIALNRLVPKQSPLMTRLQFVGDAIFIPFFLVSVGLLVDVTVLGSLRVWALALTFGGAGVRRQEHGGVPRHSRSSSSRAMRPPRSLVSHFHRPQPLWP